MGCCWSSKIKAESPSYWAFFVSGSKTKASSDEAAKSDKLYTPSFSKTSRNSDDVPESSNLKIFTFNNLKNATRNFRPDSVLGQGGFGSVFKGWIDENTLTATKPGTGMVIAVKKLNQDGLQGHREWLTEVNCLGQLHHPNLVKLIGYCLENEHRLLVYEFMSKGSLENHLFRRGSHFQPLSWNLRMKIALDSAKGLAFLHSPEAKVIYRDFKTSNVLLDTNYAAKLSDFGLAKDGPSGSKSYVSTRVMGTHGYAAPEYLATGHLNSKSDVYSFGVVLLELLSGKRSIDPNRPSGQHFLVEWAKPQLSNKRKVLHVFDTRMDGQYSINGAYKAAALTLRCLSLEPKHRPRMGEVVSVLEQLQNDKQDKRTSQTKLVEAGCIPGSNGQGPRRNLVDVMRKDKAAPL